MCGIVFYKSFNHSRVNKRILKQYKRQAHRGQEGFGFYLPQSNRLAVHPAEERIKSLLKSVRDPEIMFHHRFPTSTRNVKNACHPFSTKDYFGDRQFVMVHNGWLTNDNQLADDHELMGIPYVSVQPDGSFNDSEALLYDLALVLTGQQPWVHAEGAVAFVMVERYKGEPVKLHFGRNHMSPLNLNQTPGGMGLASEGPGEPIKVDTLYTFDYHTKQITTKPLQLPTRSSFRYPSYEASGNGTYGSAANWNRPTPKYEYVNPTTGAMGEVLVPVTARTFQGDAEAVESAGELLATMRSYHNALTTAESRKRAAQHRLLGLNKTLDEHPEVMSAGDNITEQMEQIKIINHYEEVCDILKSWQLEDHTLTPENQLTARASA